MWASMPRAGDGGFAEKGLDRTLLANTSPQLLLLIVCVFVDKFVARMQGYGPEELLIYQSDPW